MFIDHSEWPTRAYEGPERNPELRVSILDEQYARGWYRENYPVPVTLDIADSSIGWTLLSGCPCKGACTVCCSNFIDQAWDDYYRSMPEEMGVL